MWKRWHGHIGFKVHALMRISKYMDLYTSLNYLSVIYLFLCLNSFLSSRSPIFLIIYDLCIFLNCIFLLGHLLLSFDHCVASKVSQKYHFKMFSSNFFFCFSLLFWWKWIRLWVYQVCIQFNKKCFTQILIFFI